MVKKFCAASGVAIAATAGALVLGAPAYAGGHHDNNVNTNSIHNKVTSVNYNKNTAAAVAKAEAAACGLGVALGEDNDCVDKH